MTREKNILLVEDSDDDVILIQRALRKGGIHAPIRLARDGEEAIDFFSLAAQGRHHASHPLPTVVLLDLKLPKKNGFEVLEWIKGHAQFASLPVVVFTSSVQERDLKQAYALGANSYLKKPATMTETTDLLKIVGAYWLDSNVPAPVLQRLP